MGLEGYVQGRLEAPASEVPGVVAGPGRGYTAAREEEALPTQGDEFSHLPAFLI